MLRRAEFKRAAIRRMIGEMHEVELLAPYAARNDRALHCLTYAAEVTPTSTLYVDRDWSVYCDECIVVELDGLAKKQYYDTRGGRRTVGVQQCEHCDIWVDLDIEDIDEHEESCGNEGVNCE